MEPMTYPLLTRWIALGLHKQGHEKHREVFADVAGKPGDYCYDEAGWIISEGRDEWDMDPAIADRLERALDVCQYHGYGYICNGSRASHDAGHYPSHPFVPLVKP